MTTPTNIDEYLADVPEKPRAALEKLRAAIRSAAPNAVETISYQIPTFKYDDRPLVSFAAFKDHCSLFPASKAVMETFRKELEAAGAKVNDKGTIQFPSNKSLPSPLVRKMVKARMAETDAARLARSKRKR